MSTTRAVAHILGRPVMGQTTSGIKSCIAIKKAEDDRRADLKKARDELAAVIREKESALGSKKRKQSVLDTIMPSKSKQSSAPNTKKSNKEHLDRAVARFFVENAIPFNVATSSIFADMIGESMSFSQHNSLQSYKIPGRLHCVHIGATAMRPNSGTFKTSWAQKRKVKIQLATFLK